MKKQLVYFALASCLCFQSCWLVSPVDEPNNFDIALSNYEPVIISRSELEASTIIESPKTIQNSGKIYVKDELLFINERNKGFHVFNNSNPENPVKIAFIKVLGSSDLAVKNNILYINNATDLITLTADLATNTIEITKRIANTFPQMISPEGFQYNNLNDNQIIIDWILND